MAEHGPRSIDGNRPECRTCRQRKVKGCDNGQPHCNNCVGGGFLCDNSSRSFTANVASSAAGLLRDTFSSSGDHIGATLSQALQEGSKAGSSSGIAASASGLICQPTPRPDLPLATGVTSGNDAFRSSTRPPNAPRESFEGMTLDQFLQSEPKSHGKLFDEHQQLDKGKRAIYSNSNSDVTRDSYETQFNSAWQAENMEDPRFHDINSFNDGDEVVKLLSDSNFQLGLWTTDESEEPYTITDEEIQISRWFTQKAQAGAPQREQIQKAVAAARSGRAYQEFASIFDDIESYQEDVWGYIRPLVEAAREEQHIAKPTATGDGPAVHRLRMIVAHLQAPAL